MLRRLRNKLKKFSLLHSVYMKIKRSFSDEILGMTSKTEQEYFHKYARENYSGGGEVVDLGCWLGSTTIPLAKGLSQNPVFLKNPKKIYAYDLFIWFDWMNSSVAGTNLTDRYKEGDNFVDEFKRRTEKYESYIEICEGDLAKTGWNGKQIEFLLVDAMKNWELTNAIIRDFYPSLIPDKSLILHQDFGHYFTPWIHLLQWKFKDSFEFIEEIPKSQSVVFKYINKIDEPLLRRNYSFEDFTDDEVNQAFNFSMNSVSEEKLPDIAAAKVMWYVHQNKIEKAIQVYKEFYDSGIKEEKDFAKVKEEFLNTL